VSEEVAELRARIEKARGFLEAVYTPECTRKRAMTAIGWTLDALKENEEEEPDQMNWDNLFSREESSE
jgi:hypothetical protein